MDLAALDFAFNAVSARLPAAGPRCGLILGSGWGDMAESMERSVDIDYADIPGMGRTAVPGHAGRLSLASVDGTEMIVFCGRRHWYEGLGWTPIAVPIYIMKRIGVSAVLLTNAAGGLRPDFQPGDLMVVEDHINMLGSNPLVGPHESFWGPRFPDQANVYDPELRAALSDAAAEHAIELHHGVYLATTGPVYETPAEVRAFIALGADAVGMSTVPEAILANACGMKVAAVSCITNHAAGIAGKTLSHDDVTRAAATAMPRMRALAGEFAARLGDA